VLVEVGGSHRGLAKKGGVLVEDDVMVGGAVALGEEVGGAAVDDGDGHTGRRGGVLADDGGVLVEVGGNRRGLAENNGALVEDNVVVGGAAELGEGSGGARGKILATRRFRFVFTPGLRKFSDFGWYI
jgi:hypothetical protein